jgi:anaerobic ribonucleoside-triphosphate reductase activating protein
MRIGAILTPTYTDGPGERVSLYMAGCSIRCAGCQNPHLFVSHPAQDSDVFVIARTLLAAERPISILGGEPFDQAGELALLLTYLALADFPWVKPLIVYTGYTWESLAARADSDRAFGWALDCVRHAADYLVDGPYERGNTDRAIGFRGSYNQRVLDLRAMYRARSSTPLVCDWDVPTLTITPSGALIATGAVMEELAAAGLVEPTPARPCGEAPRR